MSRPVLAAIGLLIAGAAAQAAEPVRYRIQFLADLPGGIVSSQGMAINASGLVGGQSVGADGYLATTWAAPDRQPTSLGDLPGGSVSSMVYAINDAGTTVGTGYTNSGVRAFRREAGGAMVDLGDLPGGSNASGAWAVNNAGTVAGYSYGTASGSNPAAVVWDASGLAFELGDLPGGSTSSQAKAINDAGVVAGVGQAAGGRHAFVWTAAGGMVDLGDLAGGTDYADVTGINEAGWVVGSGTAGNVLHAALWKGGQVFDLGAGGTTSVAQDVNNHDQIVGASGGRAALWTPQLQMVDLNTLVDGLPVGTVLSTAMSINDGGQITGWAVSGSGTRVGYVLSAISPVPEPGRAATMLAGLLACASIVRRRRAAAAPRR